MPCRVNGVNRSERTVDNGVVDQERRKVRVNKFAKSSKTGSSSPTGAVGIDKFTFREVNHLEFGDAPTAEATVTGTLAINVANFKPGKYVRKADGFIVNRQARGNIIGHES
jgi:hypothetical protein